MTTLPKPNKPFEHLESHWAVSAIPPKDRQRAEQLLDERKDFIDSTLYCLKLTGRPLNDLVVAYPKMGRPSPTYSTDEKYVLDLTAEAYEMAAIEGLPALLHPSPDQDALRLQCITGAKQAFRLRSLLPVPQAETKRIFHVLHLASLACCGDRRTDIQQWLNENPAAAAIPSVTDQPWDHRMLYCLFECWIRLLRKQDPDELTHIQKIIDGLRKDQQKYEKTALNNDSNTENQAMALRLIALYHWAKATELLAHHILQSETQGINALLDKHFKAATEAATASGDAPLEMLLRWLHAASRQMTKSL
jgi:hypothetical protein